MVFCTKMGFLYRNFFHAASENVDRTFSTADKPTSFDSFDKIVVETAEKVCVEKLDVKHKIVALCYTEADHNYKREIDCS